MNKRKTIRILSLTIALLAAVMMGVVYFGAELNRDTLLTKLYVMVFNGNTLKIELADKINPKTIKITDNDGRIIYEDGSIVRNIKNEYGHTIFNFYYRDELIASGGHFKTNWWHTHDYDIFVNFVDGMKVVKIEIDGPNKGDDAYIKYLFDKGDGVVRYESYKLSGEVVSKGIE